MPSGHAFSYNKMSPEVLLRIYRRLKSNPLRTFVLKDLTYGDSYRGRTYLRTLIRLGLIERVICYCPRHGGSRYRTYGYRIINKETTE